MERLGDPNGERGIGKAFFPQPNKKPIQSTKAAQSRHDTGANFTQRRKYPADQIVAFTVNMVGREGTLGQKNRPRKKHSPGQNVNSLRGRYV